MANAGSGPEEANRAMTTPDELPVLDRDHLSAMTGGDADLAAEVIEIFREQAAIWGRLLTAQEPVTSWTDAAHSLKGAALGIGAIRLAKLCTRAETLGRSHAPSQTEAAVVLSDVRAGLNDALEAAAVAAHELAGSAGFSASKDPNS
ncbi:MAG: Hpt domain-containing protein [Pseudomonadota bacterium]